MRRSLGHQRGVGVVAVAVTLAGLVGASGSWVGPAGATTFNGVQCHGTLNGNPLPDAIIGKRAITVDVVAPSLAAVGSQFVVTIKGSTATLPAMQSGLTINNFTNLSTTLRLDGAKFVSGSAAAKGTSTIDGTPVAGSITLTSNTIRTASPGPIHPGTLVTPDVTVKVQAGAAGTAITVHAVELTTTANLTGATAPLDCPLPSSPVATTNVVASCAAHDGYWLVGADGGVFSFGTAQFFGSTAGRTLSSAVVGVASTPDGNGYWLTASDGGIFAFGDATFHGSLGGTHLNQPIVGMTATPTGRGYWLTASDGGVFAFGDATFHGSLGAAHLNQPIVAMTATPTGRGYWLTARDGGIFAFGDAQFAGSLGGTRLNQPIVAMTATRSGQGYWLAAGDGGVFAFGNAKFGGSIASDAISTPVVGMHNTVTGGYRVAARDGSVFAFQAPSCGSVSGQHLAAPIVAIEAAAQPT